MLGQAVEQVGDQTIRLFSPLRLKRELPACLKSPPPAANQGSSRIPTSPRVNIAIAIRKFCQAGELWFSLPWMALDGMRAESRCSECAPGRAPFYNSADTRAAIFQQDT